MSGMWRRRFESTKSFWRDNHRKKTNKKIDVLEEDVTSLSQQNTAEILKKYRIVAVVGLSRDPSKESYRVANFLKEHGFHIIPVNPTTDQILNEKSYKSLAEIPIEIQRTVEIVDIFRPSEDVSPIVEQAVQLRKEHGVPHVVWMQLGIINEEAAALAKNAGITVIMDKCMMQEYRRLFPH
jgi:predicted CoA-binding protein